MVRPRKLYVRGEEPINKTLQLPNFVWELLPKDLPMNAAIKNLIIAGYGSKKQYRREELRSELSKIESSRASIVAQLAQIEIEEKRDEELKRSLRIQNRYLARAFSQVILKIVRNGGKAVNVKEEVVRKMYGISFSRSKANEDFPDIIEENLRELTDTEIVETYALTKENKGTREDEILESIRESMEVQE